MARSKHESTYIIGIDEVGRGALAGPVIVAVVAATTKFRIDPLGIPRDKSKNYKLAKLRDSKKLTPHQREVWFQWIKEHSNILKNVGMFFTTASVSPKVIDRINISNAANLAATRAFKKLTINNKHLTIDKCAIYLDGGLRLKVKGQRSKVKCIIRGDEKIPAIMLASIVAKVTRDRMMVKLHKKYPKYNFDRHKGYGTKKHIKAIRKHGSTKVHRLAFLKKIH